VVRQRLFRARLRLIEAVREHARACFRTFGRLAGARKTANAKL
jgi:hypothetical protein